MVLWNRVLAASIGDRGVSQPAMRRSLSGASEPSRDVLASARDGAMDRVTEWAGSQVCSRQQSSGLLAAPADAPALITYLRDCAGYWIRTRRRAESSRQHS